MSYSKCAVQDHTDIDDDLLIADLKPENKTETLDDEEMETLRGGFAPSDLGSLNKAPNRFSSNPRDGLMGS